MSNRPTLLTLSGSAERIGFTQAIIVTGEMLDRSRILGNCQRNLAKALKLQGKIELDDTFLTVQMIEQLATVNAP